MNRTGGIAVLEHGKVGNRNPISRSYGHIDFILILSKFLTSMVSDLLAISAIDAMTAFGFSSFHFPVSSFEFPVSIPGSFPGLFFGSLPRLSTYWVCSRFVFWVRLIILIDLPGLFDPFFHFGRDLPLNRRFMLRGDLPGEACRVHFPASPGGGAVTFGFVSLLFGTNASSCPPVSFARHDDFLARHSPLVTGHSHPCLAFWSGRSFRFLAVSLASRHARRCRFTFH